MGITISRRQGIVGATAFAVVAGAVFSASLATAAGSVGGVVTTNGPTLSVRSAASTSSTKIGRVADGARLSIVCRKAGETVSGRRGTTRQWDKLSSGGYVSHAYVRLTGGTPPRCGSSTKPGTGRVVTNGGAGLYVRSAPSPSAGRVGRLSSGATVTVKCQAPGTRVSGTQGTTSLWDRLTTGGYVSAAYVATPGSLPRCTGSTPPPSTPPPAPGGGMKPLASHPKGLGYQNGKLDSVLCRTSQGGGYRLYCPAVDSFEAMKKAFRARFGKELTFTDGYRSYEQQVDCRRRKGSLCAVPGTSNHGWGLAIDFASNVNGFHTAEHRWMRANAPKYGWVLPSWAQENGSKPEPWHWERTYREGGQVLPAS